MATVGIVIPNRPEYGNAYYALQRKWDSGGPYVIEVDEAQLAELRADPVLTLIEDADALAKVQAATKAEADAQAALDAAKPGKPMKR